jgi:hypothetical protein
MTLRHGRKSPTWSWFNGLVPVEAVWDYKKETLMRSGTVTKLILDACSLWDEHTVDMLIRYFQNESREIKRNWAIEGFLRSKVENSIRIAKLSNRKKQRLLYILDLKPKAWQRHVEKDKREFVWDVESFVTEEEREKLRSVVHQESWVQVDRIFFSGPLYTEDARFCEVRVDSKTLRCNITEKESKHITKATISFCYNEHQDWNMLILFRKKLFRR